MRDPLSYADALGGRAAGAADAFLEYDQQRTDRIVEAVFEASYEARLDLARLAFEETGMGLYEHKVIKNAWASLLIFQDIRARRTVGVIAEDPARGIAEIARPRGPILATVPVTNPTSTAIFKALICMKTRNPVIFSPHRGARRCIKEAVRICAEAADRAGAPPDAIQFISKPQTEYVEGIMRHRRLALIVATGTGSIVRLAQSSGTPTLGVGPGNVPVYVHRTADLEAAARRIVHSKTFDNGVVCASEQALIVEPDVFRALRPLMEARGAWFCDRQQAHALGPVCFDAERRGMRADVVGQSAATLAGRAGFEVPPRTRLLVAEPEGAGPEHPLSYEILAPVLALYLVRDETEAIATCRAINEHGGIGHTIGVYAEDERIVDEFARLNAARILVNQPCTEGAIGGIFNGLRPSLTLACGTGAGNVTTDNITVDHLLNIHRVARYHENRGWAGVGTAAWLDPAVGARQALRLYERGTSEPSSASGSR
jgi:acetaldehyde dehydrogenase / alcohol dehydrogenase